MQLSEAIKALCIATRADGRSPRTVAAYREKLGHLVRFLGDPPVDTITVHDLRRYIAVQHDQGLSPFTVASRVRALKRLFNWLCAEGVLSDSPARRIKTPRPPRTEPKGISTADLAALLRTTEGKSLADLRDRAVILFLADTGCRAGGLCGLRVQDVDLDAMRATVTEKRNKTRAVFFTEPTRGALAAWLDVRPSGKGPWVFVGLGPRGKGALTPSGLLQLLKRRGERAGVTGAVNPHAFRHALARHFLLDGGDIGVLCDLMGHTDVSVTKQFYAIFEVGELQRKHRQHSPVMGLLGGKDDNGNR